MAKPKSKAKSSYPIGKERGHCSWSENSSTESEKSLLTINPEGYRHNSEVLKRHRHYQEFKRLYRLKSKERRDGKNHDTQSKWSDAVAAARRKESTEKIPLKRMTSSKISHRQKSYIDKIVSKYQKAPTSKKASCESVKLMYSTIASVDEEKRKYSHNRHEDKEEYEKERDRIRRIKDGINETKRKHEESSHDKYRRSATDKDIEEEEEYHRQRKKHHRHVDDGEHELPLEQEYYRKYHRHHEKDKNSASSPTHSKHRRDEYDDDEFERRRKIYENYQKYVRSHSVERDQKHRSRDYDNKEPRSYRHRSDERETPHRSDHTDKLKKYDTYDKYKYEREHRRHDSPDEKIREDHLGHRHRSKSSRSSKYPDDEDYEMIERLERYIMEKKIGNTMVKQHKSKHEENPKYYLYSNENSTRVTSTDHFPLGNRRSSFTCHQVIFNQVKNQPLGKDYIEGLTFEKCSKEIQCEKDDVDIPVKQESSEEKPERDTDIREQFVESPESQATATSSQKLLIEQEVQCMEVEKKSQASETKVISRITPLKLPKQKSNLKQEKKSTSCCKPTKSDSTNASVCAGVKKPIVKPESQNNRKPLQRKQKSADVMRPKNQKERPLVVTKREPKKYSQTASPDPGKSPSLLSTISQMEERAIKTLEALKDAEKIIISEKLVEKLNDENANQEEIERQLKILNEITNKTDKAKELQVEKTTSFHQQYQEELEYKLLVHKLQELERKQNAKKEKYVNNLLQENIEKVLNKTSDKKKTSKSKDKSPGKKDSQKDTNLDRTQALKLYLTNHITRDIDNISPNASDRYGKLKFHDVEEYYDSPDVEKIKKPQIKRIKWKGMDEEKIDSDWLDVRKEDIIIDKRFNYGTDSSENNLTSDEYNENHDRYTKIILDSNDTIQEEDANTILNIKELKDDIILDANVDRSVESCTEKLVEEIRKIIEEPISTFKSGSSLTACLLSKKQSQIGSVPTLLELPKHNIISTPKDIISKSKLPIRVDSISKKVNDVTDSSNESDYSAEKLLDIYHDNGYDNEELLETLQRVIDYQKFETPSSTPRRISQDSKSKNKQSTFQRVKKMIIGDKKKDNKKPTKKQNAFKKIETQNTSNTSPEVFSAPEEETLRQAINLFNIHKSTLSLVHGEINHLEHKISLLLEKREKAKKKKSKIPRLIC